MSGGRPGAGASGGVLARYGMVLVLLVLCAFFSWATHTEQSVTGSDGARVVADRLAAVPASGRGAILIVGRDTEADRVFVQDLERQLKEQGTAWTLAGAVAGEPRQAREALERWASTAGGLGWIAATTEAAEWTVIRQAAERFPALGRPRVVVPEGGRWPTFLTRQNLVNVANQIAVVAILAVGMTLVVIAGGIDLSVGSLIALSAVGVTVLIRDRAGGVEAGTLGLVLSSVAAVAACAGIGMVSGGLVAWFRVPPFIATLAVMQVASGVAFIVAKGGSIYDVPDRFTWLGRGTGWFGVPHAVLLMLALYAGTHLLMTRTVLGRWIYAVGGNADAARLAGLNVTRVLLFAYAFCGAMAGLGGVVQASQLKSGAPTYGALHELYAIAAVVVGGTSLTGGEGRVMGTLVGALIIAVIQNGMNLTGVESYRQKVVLGLVILGAVLIDLLKKRDWRLLARRLGWGGEGRSGRA